MRPQTFWHGHNNERHRDDKNLDERDTPLAGCPLRVMSSELDKVPDHKSGKKQETGGAANCGDEFSKAIELELERRVLSVSTQR